MSSTNVDGKSTQREGRDDAHLPIEEERRLVLLAQKGDANAINELVTRHLWLVRVIAWRIRGRVDQDDLIQEGSFGLLDALRNFDPGRGLRFKTFAWSHVHGRMSDAIKKAPTNQLGTSESSAVENMPDDSPFSPPEAAESSEILSYTTDAFDCKPGVFYGFWRGEVTDPFLRSRIARSVLQSQATARSAGVGPRAWIDRIVGCDPFERSALYQQLLVS
jgi:RNA polymerase sigma factor (sigma-70 family)